MFRLLFKRKNDYSFEIKLDCGMMSRLKLMKPYKLQDYYEFECPFCYEKLRVTRTNFWSGRIHKSKNHVFEYIDY